MCSDHREFQNYVIAQKDMFWKARFEHGLPPSLLAKKAGLPLNTVASWANGTTMPAWAFSLLCRFLPDEVSTIMLEPSGKHVVPTDEEPALIDDLCCEAMELAAEYQRARHPKSPGGIEIVHTEKASIKKRATSVGSKARALSK